MAYDNQIKCCSCGISIPDVAEDAPKTALLCDKCNKLQELDEQRKDNLWSVFEGYPVEDWQHEVSEGHTRNGYWEWVRAKIDAGE